MLFRGEAYARFQALSLELSRSALADAGPLPEVVQDLLVAFVRQAGCIGENAAFGWLEAQLTAPLEEWTFVEPLNAHILGPERLRLGACEVAWDLLALGVDAATPTPRSHRLARLPRGIESECPVADRASGRAARASR
ncbi:MAG: hypothetical protein ACRD12_21900 [Acidimicrobiales bacterium]